MTETIAIRVASPILARRARARSICSPRRCVPTLVSAEVSGGPEQFGRAEGRNPRGRVRGEVSLPRGDQLQGWSCLACRVLLPWQAGLLAVFNVRKMLAPFSAALRAVGAAHEHKVVHFCLVFNRKEPNFHSLQSRWSTRLWMDAAP